ncbi:HAD-like domain-containing protein [Pelagophyceae sp. CCMP2097]|nr:HAD-like domain-containing protein [Pelagophyceae sp. CCMP2097]|mmetsp:Transcript_16696/g.57121  ORF Transcript_16696/g.57121 Transcript_16696/m.57121 type:complete len:334 (+) Transcript_16696:90-1091(+)|eukprot:CAMPEP_0184277418 /NCGR_PEP_ID=MMETSP0977-20130417/51337_1 /TAXON_ID=483370 /ORGANISM="non described non described, Strain CCMP2097" /LENGTH=333 /DNA_ID=CAMNT_0026583337 /DNA_START=69 /DNA_END=1070 /DNA_ORIENTATION=+
MLAVVHSVVQLFAVLALLPCAAGLAPAPSVLRLLSLDLDDTLWPTRAVVDDANSALAVALASADCAPEACTAAAVQARIKQVRVAANAGGGADTLTYSALRTRAIKTILAERTPSAKASASLDRHPQRASRLFELWLDARQASAEARLFDDATAALVASRAAHPSLVLAAVTNGRGDPRAIPSLAHLFDVVVSGEDADVWPHRKPARQIFDVARRKASIFAVARMRAQLEDNCDMLDVGVASQGFYDWVHVGDDLVNDVEAAKRAGAATIWFAPAGDDDGGASFSTAGAAEQARRDARTAAVDVDACVDARITTLAELPDAIERALARARQRG